MLTRVYRMIGKNTRLRIVKLSTVCRVMQIRRRRWEVKMMII